MNVNPNNEVPQASNDLDFAASSAAAALSASLSQAPPASAAAMKDGPPGDDYEEIREQVSIESWFWYS